MRNFCLNEYVGEQIKKRREELGLSLSEAAQILQIKTGELAAFEYGAREIYPDMIFKLCRVFRTNAGYFFDGIDDMD